MNIICNAGEKVGDCDRYAVLICKKNLKGRRAVIEKNGWNKKVPTKFQNNIWINTVVAEEIAADFMRH